MRLRMMMVGATLLAAAPCVAFATGGGFMTQCSADFKAAKAAKSVPADMKWNDFVKSHCAGVAKTASIAPAAGKPPPGPVVATPKPSTSIAEATPAEDASLAKPAADWTKIAVANSDKNGKPFTPGQIAAHQRAKECGAEWRADKAAGKVAGGETWPHYWSTCNARLKGAKPV